MIYTVDCFQKLLMVMPFWAVGSCRPLLEARGLASVQHDAVTMWWTIPSPLTRAGAMPSGLVMSPMCPRPLQPLNNAISDGSLDREWSGWLSARQRGKWTTATLFFLLFFNAGRILLVSFTKEEDLKPSRANFGVFLQLSRWHEREGNLL